MTPTPRAAGRPVGRTLLVAAAVGTLVGGLGAAASTGTTIASAQAKAKVTVTISQDDTELSGAVLSKRRACKADRTVVVLKQKGARGGGDDVRFASDTTELDDGRGEWSTGNTGTEGRFYAVVRATRACKADSSPTIRAVRDQD